MSPHDANWFRCVYSEVAVAMNLAMVNKASPEPSAVENAILVSDWTLAILDQPVDAEDRRARNLHDFLALTEGVILAALALVRIKQAPPTPPPPPGQLPPKIENPQTPRQRLRAQLQDAQAAEILDYVEHLAVVTRSGRYNFACCYSYLYELTNDRSNLPKALSNLRAAAEGKGPKFKASLENDPALQPLKAACPREWDEIIAGLS